MSILDEILDNQSSGPRIVGEEHNTGNINWVAGVSDPGEMIACGYLPEARRREGEQDDEYAERIRPILMALPLADRNKIMGAAVKRASLDSSTGRIAVITAGAEPVWHKLGYFVNKAMNVDELFNLCPPLDFMMVKEPMAYRGQNGEWIESDDTFSIVRTDTNVKLATVGSLYEPIQPREGAMFLDRVMGEYGGRFETAGAVHGGKKVWFMVHMPKLTYAIDDIPVENYAALFLPNDGSGQAWCYPTSKYIVCNNTLRQSIDGKSKGIGIRHTGDIDSKIADAQRAFGLAVEAMEVGKEHAEYMRSVPMNITHYANDVLDCVLDVTAAQAKMGADVLAASIDVTEAARKLLEKSFEKKIEKRGEILEEIMDIYHSEKYAASQGTAWGCLNTFTDYADHHIGQRQIGTQEQRWSRQFESIISGDRDDLKQIALAKALA